MAEVPAGVVVGHGAVYRRHRPEDTLLYQIVSQYNPAFAEMMSVQGRPLPGFVQREFDDYLKCSRQEHGFLRVRCSACHAEKLVAFSCKRRGFCPSCGARRMVDTAALLVDEMLPPVPIRQRVLSVPFPLRFLFAREPAVMGAVLGIVIRAIETHLIAQAGYTRWRAQTGAVTLIQRFGSALNLNIHSEESAHRVRPERIATEAAEQAKAEDADLDARPDLDYEAGVLKQISDCHR